MEYIGKNFARKDCKELQDGDVLIKCNVSQELAHTKLACDGKKITFEKCNLHNVELWPEAAVKGCLTIHADVNVEQELTTEESIDLKLKELVEVYGEKDVKDTAAVKFDLAAKVVELPEVKKL